MATYYQLWNNETNNLVSEFDTEAEALEEVRWRSEGWGEREANDLALLRYEAGSPQQPVAVAAGDDLLQRAKDAALSRAVAD